MITPMPNPIPENAHVVIYKSVRYYYWQVGKLFMWSAVGNCGQEDTEDAAREAARNWIRDGVSSLKRSGSACGNLTTDTRKED